MAGVIFTYPIDGMQDVPIGARLVITFSDPVIAGAESSVKLVGDDGAPVDVIPTIAPGNAVVFDAPPLVAGTSYAVMVDPAICPTAQNLPAPGVPLLTFRTRSETPRAAAPLLVTLQGSSLTAGTPLHPVFETTTLRLVFSEPLDPRTVAAMPDSVELEDDAGQPVPATVLAEGIHVSIDPVDDLIAGKTYMLDLGAKIADLDGHTLAPQQIAVTPLATRTGPAPIIQILRTRDESVDPGPAISRSGSDRNVVTISHPLIGAITTALASSSLKTELADPQALGGPIAFTIRKGARLHLSPLDVQLDGVLPSGLTIGEVTIEFLSDADGRIYRNPYWSPDTLPDNRYSPLFVDLNLDVAISATDPYGNAVLAQTILGVQTTGTAIATDGVLAIESVAAMELELLGIANAPSNFVMELITDANATVDTDSTAPVLVASYPADGDNAHPLGAGIDLIFDEPIDLQRAMAGIRLETAQGAVVPTVIESHGSAITLRPITALADGTSYTVELEDVADNAGNAAVPTTLAFSTEHWIATGVPMTVSSVFPGAPCALLAGRCSGGLATDDLYQPFTIASNAPIEVSFTQSLAAGTAELGAACDVGSVRVEALDSTGACTAAVPGTLVTRDRSISFYPDTPWVANASYRLTLVSGPDASCDAGELCGKGGVAASFDPLNGTTSKGAGGANLVIAFSGAEPSTSTIMVAETTPFTDVNGSGYVETGEPIRDQNRTALVITGHDGAITNASWTEPDCVPETPEIENCMYMQGAMPVAIGSPTTTCPLADGSQADTCIPVAMAAEAMYATSLTMAAQAVDLLTIDSATGTSVMRIREPENGGPVIGYIVDRDGTPTLIAGLELYMDAPDMSVPLSTHDLHSKPISVVLTGPMTFQADGRIAIDLTNTADIAIDVLINATITTGTVHMKLPAGEMKLQLVSRPSRGGEL